MNEEDRALQIFNQSLKRARESLEIHVDDDAASVLKSRLRLNAANLEGAEDAEISSRIIMFLASTAQPTSEFSTHRNEVFYNKMGFMFVPIVKRLSLRALKDIDFPWPFDKTRSGEERNGHDDEDKE